MRRSIFLLIAVAASLLAVLAVRGTGTAGAQPAAAPPAQSGAQLYAAQCSTCHMAYPPWLLPARSWRAIIGNLTNHFGEDASLSKGQTASVLAFAVGNAADSPSGDSRILDGLAPNATPLKITDLPVWRAIHREMLTSGQMTLGTGPHAAANCGQCHGAGGGGEGGEGGG